MRFKNILMPLVALLSKAQYLFFADLARRYTWTIQLLAYIGSAILTDLFEITVVTNSNLDEIQDYIEFQLRPKIPCE